MAASTKTKKSVVPPKDGASPKRLRIPQVQGRVRLDKSDFPRRPATPKEVMSCLVRKRQDPFYEGSRYCRRLEAALIRATVAALRKVEPLPRYVAALVETIDPTIRDDALESEWTRTIDDLRSLHDTSPAGTARERDRLLDIARHETLVAGMRIVARRTSKIDPNWVAILLAEGSPKSKGAARAHLARLAKTHPDVLCELETYRGALSDAPRSSASARRQKLTKPRRAGEPMSAAHFWGFIDHASRAGDPAVSLRELLQGFLPRDIKLFDRHFEAALEQAYRYDLWGAAYLRLGGCSDDAFRDFRADLVSRGPRVFKRVLKDPDSLADGLTDLEGNEDFLTAANEVYLAKTGRDLPHVPQKRKLTGKSWDFDDPVEMQRRYPRLYRLFGGTTRAASRRG